MKIQLSLGLGLAVVGLTALCMAADQPCAKKCAAGGKPEPGAFFARMDKNGDGQVSKDEFPGPADVFTKLDKNGDGVISKDEAPKHPGPPPEMRFKEMDTNADGKISKDEFKGPAEVFTKLDANSDGVLTKDEMPKGPRGKRGRPDGAPPCGKGACDKGGCEGGADAPPPPPAAE
ncbi:MAG: EF-hand domain-containing protein [bacterium]|nr:EF-hand domain-containing protein [bacterium]